MNRDFLIRDITPAQARKLSAVKSASNISIDQAILNLADVDRLSPEGYTDEDERDIGQHIVDHYFRCVIPGPYTETRAAIVKTLPRDAKLLIVSKDVLLWGRALKDRIFSFSENATERVLILDEIYQLSPRSLLDHRDRILILPISLTDVAYEWIGKMFAKVIIMCPEEEPVKQFRLKLRGLSEFDSPALHAGSILYPQVAEPMLRNKNLSEKKLFPLLGAYRKDHDKK